MPVFLPSFTGQPPPPKKKRTVGGFFGNVLGDVPQLARSLLIDLPTQLGKGTGYTAADLWRNDVGSAARRLGRAGAGIGLGLTRTVDQLTPSVGILKDLEEWHLVGRNEKGEWDYLFKKVDPNDIEDFQDALYEDPLITGLTVLPAVGTASRAGSIARLSKSIKRENPSLTRGDSWRLASRESRHPGVLAALGYAGGLKPRTLTVDVPGGGARAVTLPQSGSPLGRGIESLYDLSSSRLPGPLSERARGARFERRQGKEKLREEEAKVAGIAAPILDLAYRYPGIKGFLLGQKERTPTATALTTLLQLPRELTTGHALEAYLKARGQMLSEGVYTKAVHSSLEDVDDPGFFVGSTVRLENPNRGDVWNLDSVDENGAIVSRGNRSQVIDLDDVFPVKKRGNVYGPAFRERVDLDDESRDLIRSEMSELRRVVENPPNEVAFNQALAALERISDLVETYGFFINARGMSKAQRERLGERYERRRQLIVNDLVARGLIPEGMEARGYFPHFSLWRALSANWTGPVRLPSSGLVVGRPQLRADVGRRKPNDLILHQLGQVNLDPSALLYLLTMRLRYAETFAMRKDYWDIGVPLERMPRGQGGYLVRDPDRAAQSISDRTKAELNLSDEEYAKLVRQGEDTATILDDPETVTAEPRDWLAAREGPLPDWTREEGVRWLPSDVVEARFGRRVFRGEAPSMLGLGNALARLSLILSRPIRYGLSNVPSNYLMLLATNPDALLQATKLLGNSATRRLPAGVDRELLEKIRSQSGEVRATAGIPQFTTARVKPLEKAEAGVTRQSVRVADVLGTVVDEPFRIAVWMSRAKRMGFDTPEEWRRLLSAPADSALGRARQQIRQRTRDDMLDFDSLTQWEREQATRYLFVWPYLRAAIKYPLVYTRERPVIAGTAAMLAEQAPNVPLSLPIGSAQGQSEIEVAGKRFDLSQINPLSPITEAEGAAQALAHGDLRGAAEYLSPTLGLAAEAAGGDAPIGDILWRSLATFAPGGQAIRNVGDNGWRSALAEETLRFTPRKPFRSIRRDKRSEREAITDFFGPILRDPDFRRSFDAYWDYRDRYVRTQLAARERYGREALSEPEKRTLLRTVWQRHWEEPFPDVPPSPEGNEAVEDLMFKLRSYLIEGVPGDQ